MPIALVWEIVFADTHNDVIKRSLGNVSEFVMFHSQQKNYYQLIILLDYVINQ